MWQKELETPFGKVCIYKNGKKMNFAAEYFDHGMYLNDNTLKKPQGIYKLYPDTTETAKDDIIICEFNNGHLQRDGGDEYMLNAVGTFQGYTIGMGALDSHDIMAHYKQRKRVLPYETLGNTERGFEIRITDTHEDNLFEKDIRTLYFVVAWEQGTTDEAYELISFVTC